MKYNIEYNKEKLAEDCRAYSTSAVELGKAIQEELKIYIINGHPYTYSDVEGKFVDNSGVRSLISDILIDCANYTLNGDPRLIGNLKEISFHNSVWQAIELYGSSAFNEFDSDPNRINFKGESLNLIDKDIEIDSKDEQGNQGELHLKSAGVRFTDLAKNDSKGTGKEILYKLINSLPDDSIEWFQAVLGKSLIGMPGDKAYFLTGKGRNGKSLWLKAISNSLLDYVAQIDSQDLSNGSRGYSLPNLEGARIAIAEELPADKNLSVGTLKQIVRTPKMIVRRIYSEPITIDNTASLFIACNHLPQSTDLTGVAMRDRLVAIPFTKVFTTENGGDSTLETSINTIEFKSALVKWIIDGLENYLSEMESSGIDITTKLPESVQVATDAWLAGEDSSINTFLSSTTEEDDKFGISPSEIYSTYVNWCNDRSIAPKSKTILTSHIEELGFKKKKAGGSQLSTNTGLTTNRNMQVFRGLKFKTKNGDDKME